MSGPIPDPTHGDQDPDPDSDLDQSDAARRYARDAWLHRRVLDHVDLDVSGAYTWEASEYTPVPVQQDGTTGLVFAKT